MALLATLLKIVMAVILPPLAVFLEVGACARGGERGGPGDEKRERSGRARPRNPRGDEGRCTSLVPCLDPHRARPPYPPPPPPLSGLSTQFWLNLLLTLLGWLPGSIHALWLILADRGL